MKKEYLIYGVGINDAGYRVRFLGKKGKEVCCPYFRVWKSMLGRCYSKEYQETRKTYIGCSVCDEWLYFSNFKRWMEEQNWEGKQLDKDLLKPFNKKYSPETCVFIKKQINSFLVDSYKSRGKYKIGVCYSELRGKFFAQCGNGSGKNTYLGLHDTEEDAHEAWREYKHKLACKYAEEETDERVSKALRRWYEPDGWYKYREEF